MRKKKRRRRRKERKEKEDKNEIGLKIAEVAHSLPVYNKASKLEASLDKVSSEKEEKKEEEKKRRGPSALQPCVAQRRAAMRVTGKIEG